MEEVAIIIVIGTAILLLLASFIFAFMWMHQKRSFEHSREKNIMREAYAQEILKAQLEVREQTLDNISQEIHDNIGQVLSVAKLNLNSANDTNLKTRTNEASVLIGNAIQSLRDLARTMNNDYIVRSELSELLQREVLLLNNSGAYQATLLIDGHEQPFEPQRKVIVYRIVQECINNIVRHAECNQVDIKLVHNSENVSITINDNGKGFDPNSVQNGIGLSNIRNRAKLIGATFELNSWPNEGTIINVSVPINHDNNIEDESSDRR